ncbi:hypothetical protein [Paucibacter sp. KCTC 42545]|uniref:hypothetical protein n=1 Tax=Paucibacter sp. KCTC 42545 TaxID=1768242 RepID=UPI0018D20C40|nr:hypothetical protein [Paucibacter sp. KCTC 42545]
MGNNNVSPLDHLAAFAIVYVAGAISAVGLVAYSKWIQHKANQGPSNASSAA